MSASAIAAKLDMSDRRVLVTGAAGGLGTAFAHAFRGAGATLLLADKDQAGLDRLAGALGGGADTLVYDQANLASLERLARDAGPVDILINNAGLLLVKPIAETRPEEIRELVLVDLVGPMVLTRLIGPAMAARGSGVIINISSQLAFCGAEGRSVYAAAKAGLAQFTRSAAVELGRQGVRVLAVAPGRLLTPMTTYLQGDEEAYKAGIARVPVGRYGTPEEIAELVLFLASPAAGYIVGETVIADGGYVLG
jgi:NAD(P)-dependent dehydrogenase (short-subunit alcohol dehydrogenase family)